MKPDVCYTAGNSIASIPRIHVAKQKNPASLRKFESSFDARRETVTARALEDYEDWNSLRNRSCHRAGAIIERTPSSAPDAGESFS